MYLDRIDVTANEITLHVFNGDVYVVPAHKNTLVTILGHIGTAAPKGELARIIMRRVKAARKAADVPAFNFGAMLRQHAILNLDGAAAMRRERNYTAAREYVADARSLRLNENI